MSQEPKISDYVVNLDEEIVRIFNYDDIDAKPREVFITIPARPKDEEILGFDLDQQDQKWANVRTAVPKDKEFDKWPAIKQRTFVKTERERLKSGVWFYNNGTPTYVTEDHYRYLTFWRIDTEDGYPEYRDRDRRWYLYWKHCFDSVDSYGMAYLKHRRDGATHRVNSILLGKTIEKANIKSGINSKTGLDAKKNNFTKLVNSFYKLPGWQKPTIESAGRRAKSELAFQSRDPSKPSLESSIEYRDTTDTAFDGEKLYILHVDEPGKWATVNIGEYWRVHRECISVGNKIVGKAIFTTTLGEMEKGGGGVFVDRVWENSDELERDDNNRTASGLFRYFVPAYDGLEGFIDEYGMSMIKEAKQFKENTRKALKKAGKNKDLAAEKRLYPFSPREAMAKDGSQCIWDEILINDQLDFVESQPKDLLVYGNLHWVNSEKDTQVVFRPTPTQTKAKFKIYMHPIQGSMNNNHYDGSERKPGNILLYQAGADPFDHKYVTDGQASKGCGYVFRKYDPWDEDNSDLFVCQYLSRPRDPETYYEDMLKMCFYYGCELHPENNKIGIVNHFRRRGYHKFLSKRPETTHTSQATRRQKEFGTPNTPRSRAYMEDLWGDYLSKNIHKIMFRELLIQLLGYDPDNTTKYDAVIGGGWTLMAAYKRLRKQKPKKEIKLSNFYRIYDNTGGRSRELQIKR